MTVFTYTASGGLITAGAALLSKTKNYTSSDGLETDGFALVAKTKAFLSSGGLITGGAALLSKTKAYTSSDGIETDGTASISKTKAYVGSGGITTAPPIDHIVPFTLNVPLEFPNLIITKGSDLFKTRSLEDLLSSCEWMWNILPNLYKEPRLVQGFDQATVDRSRAFHRAIDGNYCSFKELLASSAQWNDISITPYILLQYIAPLVGIDFNFDLPEAFARREIANAIFLWERKGTRDNIRDWIRFLTGCSVTIREFYKEVLRWSVFGQALAGTPAYATTPDVNEHHTWSTWNNGTAGLPWYGVLPPDTNYGYAGFGPDLPGQTNPGYLFRNHVGLYIDIPEENLELSWFGTSFFTLFIQKIERIIDLIGLFGVIWHIFAVILTEEDYAVDDFEINDKIGETEETEIESLCAGRLAPVLFCWSNGAQWSTPSDEKIWYTPQVRYWTEYLDDELISTPGGTVIIPMEHSDLEILVNPLINSQNTPGNRGHDFVNGMSPWVIDNSGF